MSAYVQDKAHILSLIHYLRMVPHQRRSNQFIIYPKVQFLEGKHGWPLEPMINHAVAIDFGHWDHMETWLKVARCLYDQNVRSANYRYQNSEPEADTFELVDLPNDNIWFMPRMPHKDAWGACAGYDYQSCETPDYALTPAAAIIGLIRKLAGDGLADGNDTWRIHEFPTTAQLLASI